MIFLESWENCSLGHSFRNIAWERVLYLGVDNISKVKIILAFANYVGGRRTLP